ncbi:MAG: transposase [Lentisphaerae bacterium]|nr:transposase [Lentisphaerota bacterium]
MGTVSASELIRSLLNTKCPSELTKGLLELGRIPKTIHSLQMINDESYRRRSITQLNKSEARHGC